MTDVERFFSHLVYTLAAADPGRLRQPILLADISSSIVPYRAHRRALGLESSEDYEAILMRLCAGEGGFVRLTPEETRWRLEQELASPNPDLGVLREAGEAVVGLVLSRVMEVLNAPPTSPVSAEPPPLASQAPPIEPPVQTPVEVPAEFLADTPPDMLDALLPAPEAEAITESESYEPPATGAATAVHCLACGEALPGDRRIKFCPYCGEGLAPVQCAACSTPLEPGWRFCVTCGHPVGGRPVSRRRA